MSEFYHIHIKPQKGITEKEIKEKLNLAIDWYKYSNDNWIIKTSSDAKKWQSRLQDLVKPDGSLLIMKLDTSDRNGWMVKSFWDWLKEAKSTKPKLKLNK